MSKIHYDMWNPTELAMLMHNSLYPAKPLIWIGADPNMAG